MSLFDLPLYELDNYEAAGGETTQTFTLSDYTLPSWGAVHLAVVVNGRDTESATGVTWTVRLNGDSGGNYNGQQMTGSGSSASAGQTNNGTSFQPAFRMPGASSPANAFGGGLVLISEYANTSRHKTLITLHGSVEEAVEATAGRWANAAAVTSVTVLPSTAFVAGTRITLYIVDERYNIVANTLSVDGTFNETISADVFAGGELVALMVLRTDKNSQREDVKVNINDDDTDSNYAYQQLRGTSGAISADADSKRDIGEFPAETATANVYGVGVVTFSQYALGDNDPCYLAVTGYHESTASLSRTTLLSGRRNNVAAVTSIGVEGRSNDLKAGSSLWLYRSPKRLITRMVVPSTSVTGHTFTGPWPGYRLVGVTSYLRGDKVAASNDLLYQLNGVTGTSSYDVQLLFGSTSSAVAQQKAASQEIGSLPSANATANQFGGVTIAVIGPNDTDRHKYVICHGGRGLDHVQLHSCRFESNDQITSIKILPAGGDDLVQGTVLELWGIPEKTQEAYSHTTLLVDWVGNGAYEDIYADISLNGDARSVSTVSGRDRASQLTGAAVAGSLRAVLNNDDGRYSPGNTSSAITGKILPNRKVRLIVNDHILWTGFLRAIIPVSRGVNNAIANLTAVGPLGWFKTEKTELAMSSSTLTGTAIANILTEEGWPAADRDLDAGQTTITRHWVAEKPPVSALRDVEQTEGGFLREQRNGHIKYEDRHHRFASPHLASVTTISDASGATVGYQQIDQENSRAEIFNLFEVAVRSFTTVSIATLWTLAETGSASPPIVTGESLTFWAIHPAEDAATDVVGVDAWTTPVATTDYTVNTETGGGGTNLTGSVAVVATKYGNRMKIVLTNNHASDGFITALKARGTAIKVNQPITIREEDATSQATYDKHRWPVTGPFIPNSVEARSHLLFKLSIYKDPVARLRCAMQAERNVETHYQAVARDVSDRVTVVANNAAKLGLNEDYFIEQVRHTIDPRRGHRVSWSLSQAEQFSDFWVLGSSGLGTQTRLAY